MKSSYQTKCKHCGKPRQHHRSIGMNCPMGKHSRTLGYTSFHTTQRFEQDLKGWTPVSDSLPEAGVYVMCGTFFDGPHDFRYRPGWLNERTLCTFLIEGASWTTTHWRKLTPKERRDLEEKHDKEKAQRMLVASYPLLVSLLRIKFSAPVFNSRTEGVLTISKADIDDICPYILSDTPIPGH